MSSLWKRLMGKRDETASGRSAEEQHESVEERRLSDEGVEGVAADEVVEERLGGVDPERLVDDEFKP